MHLRELQDLKRSFDEARGWQKFAASQVYVHLTEELGEIGRQILFEEGLQSEGLRARLSGRGWERVRSSLLPVPAASEYASSGP